MLAYAKLHHVEAVVLEDDLPSGRSGKVDDQIGAFARGKNHALEFHRGRQEALIGADLVEGLTVRHGQMKEAAVGGIQCAEAVLAGLDFEIRKELSVYQQGIPENLG